MTRLPRPAVLLLPLLAVPACDRLAPPREPPTARGVLLVLAPGFDAATAPQNVPALARLASTGRSFRSAFAPEPGAAGARAALVGGALVERLRKRGVATAGVGAATTLPVDPQSLELYVPDTAAPGAPGRLEAWLRERHGAFVVLAGLGPLAPEASSAPHAALASVFAPALPRIAVADLAFGDRPGGERRPLAWSEPARQRVEAAQLARAIEADRQLGALVALLERAAPGTATIVVGDPPPDRGNHGQLGAPALFDDTLRSTLVVEAHGLARAGRATERPVSTLDVLPTLIALLGQKPAPGLPGTSLMPLLADPAAQSGGEALSSVRRRAGRLGRSARSARYRYTEWPDGSRELYDHEQDPAELTNLATRPEHSATVAELGRALSEREASPPSEASAASAPRARPRNVLLLVIDDLNTRVGPWGAPVRTPALDRLAARGVRFERAYVQAAMCSPSRVSMLTGWRPERTGVWQNQDPPRPAGALPLQELFAAHGSLTVSVGKIYHSPADFHWDLPETAFDEPEEHSDAPETGAAATPSEAHELWVKAAGGDLDQPDGQRARRAIALLERRATRPFFLALGLVRPHQRWIAPARYFALYPPASIEPPPFDEEDLADVPAIAVKTHPQPLPQLPLMGREPPGLVRDPERRREAIAAYQACVSFADAQVGRVLDALDRRGLWQDTVVVLVGDNGFHLGEHGLLRKNTLFEEALHVPLIVAAPGLAHPGAVVRAPVEVPDLYPTIVELGGLAPQPGLDGQSLVPLIENPDGPGRGVAVSYRRVQPPERGFSLRTDRLRYTLWPDGSEELYERVGAQPESENLAALPRWASEKSALRARLTALVEAAAGR